MIIRYNGKLFDELTLEEARAALEEMADGFCYDDLPYSFEREREPEKQPDPDAFQCAQTIMRPLSMHWDLIMRTIRHSQELERLERENPPSDKMSTLELGSFAPFGEEEQMP